MNNECTRCGSKETIFDYSYYTIVRGKQELNLCPKCCKWALINCFQKDTKLLQEIINKAKETRENL